MKYKNVKTRYKYYIILIEPFLRHRKIKFRSLLSYTTYKLRIWDENKWSLANIGYIRSRIPSFLALCQKLK